MVLIRSDKKGVPRRLYRLNWTPGNRILRLPKWIQPLALLYRERNVLRRYWLDRILYREQPEESERQVQENLSLGAQYVYEADVKGDIAEFGTMSGFTASIISFAMSKFDKGWFRSRILQMPTDERFKPKKLFLFDSFQGLPVAESEVDKNSSHVRTGVWGTGSCLELSKEELRGVCIRFLPSERIVIYDGWFKDTLPQIPSGTKFSMLHIDCDLYQSTVDVLDFCFSHGLLSEGAAIFFDDWNPNRASPQLGERRAWSEIVEKYSIVYSDWGDYSWGGKRFLIHSYHRTIS